MRTPAPSPAQLMLHADMALRSALAAVAGTEPARLGRAAAGAAYLDLWVGDRLLRADGGNHSAPARFLLPRLLMESADALSVLLGAQAQSNEGPGAAYRGHARRLHQAMWHPDHRARLDAVTARLDGPPTGEDRLARPLTSVRPAALPLDLHALLDELERERRAVVGACAPAPARASAGAWALADRYALLTAAAACLDGWRGAGRGRRITTDRVRLVAALSRIAVRLGLEPVRPDTELSGALFDEAVAHCRRPTARARTSPTGTRRLVGA
ncbi:hypothetical protein ACH4JS_30055 [Streptomyces sp. NPDC017638]|uniref:hypothetical protein n=1 Tax=Streptomyces sp. NPDC017638 TaxID=3365004 RepID=UPI0037A9D082